MLDLRAALPLILLAAATCGTSSAAAQGRTPSLEGYLTLANDYRHRGLSQLESGVSWQVGVDYEHASGFFFGAIAANVEYPNEAMFSTRRDRVFDAYAGYAWQSRDWRFNVALGRYVYPGISYDYDYSEVSFGATFMSRFSYTAGFSDDFYSRAYSAWRHEIGVAQPLPRDFELSAALGRFDFDLVPGGGYSHWDVGVSKILRRIGIDLRFYETTLEGPAPIGDPGGQRWVLSLSYAFSRL